MPCTNPNVFIIFLSTPSARRATGRLEINAYKIDISIHALREEGDPASVGHAAAVSLFLSTPSARRATLFRLLTLVLFIISIHALREEGDVEKYIMAYGTEISIHALREEGDEFGNWRHFNTRLFLSTPSARRATDTSTIATRRHRDFYPRPPRGGRRRADCLCPVLLEISIHALREEGDLHMRMNPVRLVNFYPRPPRGGRPAFRAS